MISRANKQTNKQTNKQRNENRIGKSNFGLTLTFLRTLSEGELVFFIDFFNTERVHLASLISIEDKFSWVYFWYRYVYCI